MKCIFRAQDSKGNTFTETIHPFKEWQDKVYEAAINFWNNHILTDTPPELTDQDTVDMGGNEELALLLSEYESTDAQIKDLEEYKADCRGKIDELCTSTRAKCAGYLMYRSSRAGNIDYKKIPELKGMDLEKYRSKPSSVFTIKKVKEE
jgi:predicted phage-related endonuclease